MQSLGLEKDADPSLPTGWIIAISVAVGGAMLALQLRKRDGAATSRDTIRVVSTRQVGPKARVVLIETRGREILLSVGDRGASLISDWWVEGQAEKEKVEEKEPAASLDDKWFEPAEEASDAAEPTPAPAPIRREERRAPATPAPAPAVSAVSGLVRLRTKSTTRGSKQTSESQLLADDLLDAGPRPGRLDVTATQLYGQWSKQLLGR